MKHLFLTGAILASLASSGCQLSTWESGSTANFWIQEEGFNKDQIESIRSAIGEWDHALTDKNGRQFIHMQFVNGKGFPNLIVIRSTTLAEMNDEVPGRAAVTMTNPWEDGGGIYLPKDMRSPWFKQVTLHEMGHAFQMGHLPQQSVLMNAHLKNGNHHVTCDDVKEFCDANGGCIGEDFPICIADSGYHHPSD